MATIIQKPNVFLKLQMEQFYNSILHTTFISLYWILLEASSNVVYTPTSGRLAVCGGGVNDDSRWSIYIVGVDISALVGGHHHQSPPPASPAVTT